MKKRKIGKDTASMRLLQIGRIGRLAKQIEKAAGRTTAEKIMKDAQKFKMSNPAGKAAWLKQAIKKIGTHPISKTFL